MQLKELHCHVVESKYKPWQVYFMTVSLLFGIGLHFRIGFVISLLKTIESATSRFDWVVILGIQGVLIGFIAESLYEQGDRYAKSASHLFGSKDRTLVFRVGLMTIVSAIITKVVPAVLENVTEYLVIQTIGAVLALGIMLVHTGSSNWKAQTEWPAIVAGTVVAVLPSIT
jgi:hypothetical protein